MMGGPPLKIEKIFFAFLDELDHSKHKIKSVTMTSDPPPRKKSVTNVTLFFSTLKPSLMMICNYDKDMFIILF